jgi:hypothetical protein
VDQRQLSQALHVNKKQRNITQKEQEKKQKTKIGIIKETKP